MDSNTRQATTHKAVETVFKFFVVLFSGDAALSRCTFRTMINNLKLTNINGGRNKPRKIVIVTGKEIIKPFIDIKHLTAIVVTNIARRVSSLRLVTDVR